MVFKKKRTGEEEKEIYDKKENHELKPFYFFYKDKTA